MIIVLIVFKLIDFYVDMYIKFLNCEFRDFYEGVLWIILFVMGIGGLELYF